MKLYNTVTVTETEWVGILKRSGIAVSLTSTHWKIHSPVELNFHLLGLYFLGLLSLFRENNVFSCDKISTAEDVWREETDHQSAPGGLMNEVPLEVDSVM
jgi:hypothetical protein